MPAGASFCVAVPYSHGIAEEMLSHISQENDKLNGALDGAAGCAGMKTQNCKPRCLSVSLMALPNRRNCQGKLFTQNIGAHESKAPEGVLPVSQTQQGEAQIWRREVSSRYGQYPKAQAAQPDQLMSDYFFPRVAGDAKQNAAFLPR
ncbi:putative membrane protein YfaA [Escherichia coli]|nr:putative membrane protein YfaA [Escherichia coli]